MCRLSGSTDIRFLEFCPAFSNLVGQIQCSAWGDWEIRARKAQKWDFSVRLGSGNTVPKSALFSAKQGRKGAHAWPLLIWSEILSFFPQPSLWVFISLGFEVTFGQVLPDPVQGLPDKFEPQPDLDPDRDSQTGPRTF